MATVYLAQDLKHDRPVALKVMHPELIQGSGRERFQREIRLAARLQHPHIVPIHDSGEDGALLWYTMALVEGESLRNRLAREQQLPVADAIRITREVAEALDYAHARGVVHRDIKPENILLAGYPPREGDAAVGSHALVADFGVARGIQSGGAEQLTGTGMAVGTPAYMSPEQASGNAAVDGRSDIYSLGCVLYEMLAGEAPFTGHTPQAVLAKRLLEPVPHVRTLRETAPPEVDQALQRAMAKLPADRFPTAEAFAEALSTVDQTEDKTRHVVRASPVWSRRITRVALALGLGLILLIGGIAGWWRHSQVSHPTLDPNLVAVAPFEVFEPSLRLWREGVVDLLARDLDGAGPLRTVPPTAVVRRWHGGADPESATELGRRLGARLVVFGSLVSAGADSTRLKAVLLDAGTGNTVAEVELRDATNRIDRLTDSTTVRLLRELGRSRGVGFARAASLGSTSLPAIKAFLQGEQWFRQAAWDSSLAAFERAVALDSSFCIAVWRLALVAGWQHAGLDSLVHALALRAGRLNHGLAPRDSLLVEFASVFSSAREGRTHYDRLVRIAKQAISRYPTDVDAWSSLAEAYTHFGLNYGVGAREALAALDQAIALDSAYAPAYIHAIEFAAGLHGLEGARRYANEYLRRAPGDVTAQGIRLALAVADPARQPLPETRRALETASANVLLKAWLPLIRAPDSTEAAVDVARYFAASPEGSAPWLPASFKQAALVFTLMYRGHLREATRQWSPGIWEADAAQVTLALLGAGRPDSADQAFHRWLAAGDVLRGTRALAWWGHRRDTLALRRMQRLSDSLARSSPAGLQRELATYAAPAAEAYLVLARGDTAGALGRFKALPDSLCERCLLDVLTKVSLLAAKAEDAEVLAITDRWQAVQPTPTVGLLALAGARAAERLHDRTGATRRYQFVADLWRHADPELQPYVEEALAALKRLGEEST